MTSQVQVPTWGSSSVVRTPTTTDIENEINTNNAKAAKLNQELEELSIMKYKSIFKRGNGVIKLHDTSLMMVLPKDIIAMIQEHVQFVKVVQPAEKEGVTPAPEMHPTDSMLDITYFTGSF